MTTAGVVDGYLLLERISAEEKKDAMRVLRQRALGLPADEARAH